MIGLLLFRFFESESEVAQSYPTLCDPMDSSLQQTPLSVGFSRQEYWSGLPFLSPGNLPDPGMEHRSPVSYTDALPSEPGLDLKSLPNYTALNCKASIISYLPG